MSKSRSCPFASAPKSKNATVPGRAASMSLALRIIPMEWVANINWQFSGTRSKSADRRSACRRALRWDSGSSIQYRVLLYSRLATTKSSIRSKAAFSPPDKFLNTNPRLSPFVKRKVPFSTGFPKLWSCMAGNSAANASAMSPILCSRYAENVVAPSPFSYRSCNPVLANL